MKKIAFIVLACLLLTLHASALAARRQQVEDVPENPMDWHISSSPEMSEKEKEAARWSLILENDLGIYAYDMGTLGYVTNKKGTVDTNLVGATVKTLFTDKKVLKKVQDCLLEMQYNMAERTYTVKEMQVFTNKNRLIETKKNKTGFVPIPEKSFAEAMYEICQQFVAETATAGAGEEKPALLSNS